MKRPNITPGNWTAEPAMEKQDCGIRIHTPESAAYGMAHIYSPGANVEANARAIASVPKLLEAMEDLIPFADVDLEPDELTVEVPIEKLMKLKFALQDAGYTFD